jgi:predicted transcriptional regulator of viral defense system
MKARDRVARLANRHGVILARNVRASGIHTQALTRLEKEGAIERVGRGLYSLAGAQITEHHGLALAASSVPKGVVCLLSALRFHDVTTQNPFEIWLAIEQRSRAPKLEYPPLRILRFSGRAFTSGVETHRIEGQRVRVYSLPKTIADLFKFRRKVGVDVAVEALREAIRSRKLTPSEIDPYARVCRVRKVMRPYLEALFE